MKPLIPPSHYSDPAIFAKEMDVLFRGTWQFAGFTFDLPNHNDFVTRDIGGKSVFIQNFNGELKAFSNVCAHRFNRLRHEESGNGPVRCGYHGWIYNEDGCPVGIPQKHLFEGRAENCGDGLHLIQWQLEVCGTLIFVLPAEAGPSLTAFLGETVFDRVERISLALGRRLATLDFTIDGNWKVLVENGLDSYHVDAVHPNTYGTLGVAEYTYACDPPHTTVYAVNRTTTEKAKRRAEREGKVFAYCLTERPLKDESYSHLLVFPNLTITSFSGAMFVIQEFCPLTSTRTFTRFHVFFTSLPQLSQARQMAADLLAADFTAFITQVCGEDVDIIRGVHDGLADLDDDAVNGVYGRDEIRVFEFQKAYQKVFS